MNLKKLLITFCVITVYLSLPLSLFAINPQPEPPGKTTISKIINPIEKITINPQPEPPKQIVTTAKTIK